MRKKIHKEFIGVGQSIIDSSLYESYVDFCRLEKRPASKADKHSRWLRG